MFRSRREVCRPQASRFRLELDSVRNIRLEVTRGVKGWRLGGSEGSRKEARKRVFVNNGGDGKGTLGFFD